MNQAEFTTLKPGGVYAITDKAPAPGNGPSGCERERLQRIDEQPVRDKVTRAGFRLAEDGFLRKRQDQDRFALRSVNP